MSKHQPQYRVEISTPQGVLVNEKGLSQTEAEKACQLVLDEHPTDATLQTQLGLCMAALGFRGYGGRGYSITISAALPRISTGQLQSCPGRLDYGYGYDANESEPDEWVRVGDDLVCSYCGSLHPERMLEIIREHGLDALDQGKPGKWWVRQPDVPNAGFGGLKFYLYHATPAFKAAFAEASAQ